MSDIAKPRFRRLPARSAALLLPFLLSLIMTFMISGISTFHGTGPTFEAFSLWMSAWGLSWIIGFPVLLIVLPLVRRLVGLLVEPN